MATKYVDVYKGYNIPDRDVHTCLKVLRTLRNLCLEQGAFDANGSVILSHAHAKVYEILEKTEGEEKAKALVEGEIRGNEATPT